MLSEKAKGKQRAVESEAVIPKKELCIRFTEGIPDLTLQVGEQDTVRDIKTSARLFCPLCLILRLTCMAQVDTEC